VETAEQQVSTESVWVFPLFSERFHHRFNLFYSGADFSALVGEQASLLFFFVGAGF
jgi:hypothetical protein